MQSPHAELDETFTLARRVINTHFDGGIVIVFDLDQIPFQPGRDL
jgi:hypothetical protein